MSTKEQPQKPPETTTVAAGKSWWRESMSRRDAMSSLLRTGTGAAAVGVVLYGIYNVATEDVEAEFDALELQKKSQWNVGSDDLKLLFPSNSLTTIDSMGTTIDMTSKITDELNAAYLPSVQKFHPFMVSTLLQSLAQESLRKSMNLLFTPEMHIAYARGLGMRELIINSTDAANTLIIIDLPGPEAVAFGAAIADVASIALTFDNWPHPLGVVPAHLTLGALWYYGREVQQKKNSLLQAPPLAMILDSNRLTDYTDADNQFDNRYTAKVPSAEQLTGLGITHVLYINSNAGLQQESDDLNADFIAYQDKHIDISMLPATNFQQSDTDVKPVDTTSHDSKTAHSPSSGVQPYYYGGGYSHSLMFFYHYSTYRTLTSLPPESAAQRMNIRRPAYSATPRKTLFSSSTRGSATGVGRTKPAGFGKVSTKTSSRTGKVTGIRSGRSGSFGRSSGRSSS